MPPTGDESVFEDRADFILDEIAMAFQWERPALIVALYRSALTRNLVQGLLAQALLASGREVTHYLVDKSHYDIPRALLDHPRRGQAVYFVDRLRRGGGRGYSNAIRALNMHREYLVEGNIRAVFWLTQPEARQVARFAPDFWAFRHKVVEFLDLPSDGSPGSSQPLLASAPEEVREQVHAIARLEALGCHEEALLSIRQARRLRRGKAVLSVLSARIHLAMGDPAAARRLLRQSRRGASGRDLLAELERVEKAIVSIPQPGGGFQEWKG